MTPDEADACMYAVNAALTTVANTTGLNWEVKKRVFKQMERCVRSYAYGSPDDFAAWAEAELADLLSNEDIRPLCRISLASWFAGEVLHWLSGNFEDDSEAAD